MMKKGLLFVGIPVLVIVMAAASLQVYANHRVRKLVDEYAASLKPDLELYADTTRYNLFERSAHIEGIVLRGNTMSQEGIDAVTVDEVIIHKYDTENSTPHYAHVEMEGLAIPIPLTEEALLGAEQIGFTREELTGLKIDVQSRYRFDTGTKEFIVHQNDLQFRGFGGIRSKVHLANIDPVFFQKTDPRQTNPFLLIAAMGNIQLKSTDVFLEVGELADRIFKSLAQRSNMPVSDLKEQWASLAGAIFEGNPEVSPQLADRTIEFILKPGNVTITMVPEKPVSVMEVMELSKDSDLLMKKLNVRIEVQ